SRDRRSVPRNSSFGAGTDYLSNKYAVENGQASLWYRDCMIPQEESMSLIETRRHQIFPVLTVPQIDMAKRFASGPARDFGPGELVFDVGERLVPAWLILKGAIDVVRRDGLKHEAQITTHGAGQFSGEVSQLAGRGTLVAARAGPAGCTALPFDAAHLRR